MSVFRQYLSMKRPCFTCSKTMKDIKQRGCMKVKTVVDTSQTRATVNNIMSHITHLGTNTTEDEQGSSRG